MSRPAWTIAEAVDRTGVSASTLRRAVRSDKVPGAYKDTNGAWRLPVEGLIEAGYPPLSGASVGVQREPTPKTSPEGDEDLAQRVRELEADLRAARAEREAAQQIAHAHEQRAEAAERALRLLEAAPPRDHQGVVTDHGHDQPHDHQMNTPKQPANTSPKVNPSHDDQPPLVTDHDHDQPMTNPPRRSWLARLFSN